MEIIGMWIVVLAILILHRLWLIVSPILMRGEPASTLAPEKPRKRREPRAAEPAEAPVDYVHLWARPRPEEPEDTWGATDQTSASRRSSAR